MRMSHSKKEKEEAMRIQIIGFVCTVIIILCLYFLYMIKDDKHQHSSMSKSGYFEVISYGYNNKSNIKIVYDKSTRVMYIDNGKTFTVITNIDGTPKII